MKRWSLSIYIILFAVSIFSAGMTFTVPATIVTEDRKFTLKDIFPGLEFDRYISYVQNDKIIYSSESLDKILSSILRSYYRDFDIFYQKDEITVQYEESNESPAKDKLLKIDIKEYITKKVNEYDKDIEIINIETKMFPDNMATLTTVNTTRNKDILTFTLNITDIYGKKYYSTANIKIAKYMKIMVFSRDVVRNEMITTENTKEATMNILSEKGDFIAATGFRYSKYQSTKACRKGELLDLRYLKKLPDVKTGQSIQIKVVYEGIEILSWGTVLKDSFYGEVIEVRNTKTGQLVTGKLLEGPLLYVGNEGN